MVRTADVGCFVMFSSFRSDQLSERRWGEVNTTIIDQIPEKYRPLLKGKMVAMERFVNLN